MNRLIACLESARTRPTMYFGSLDVDAAKHYLNGVELALLAFVQNPIETRLQVLADRGWRVNALGPSVEMIERGMSPAEMIDELLVIEIETIRRLAGESAP
jgi:hypothetical protein